MTMVRPAIIQCWTLDRKTGQNMSMTEKYYDGLSDQKGQKRNKYIKGNVRVTLIVDKIRENILRQIEYVLRKEETY